MLIFSFIAAQSNAKFSQYQEAIKEHEKREQSEEQNGSSAVSYPNNENYQRSTRKYEKAKRKLRNYKNKSVSKIYQKEKM